MGSDNTEKENTLLEAADKKNWERVRHLVEAGVNVNIVDACNWTPLHYAALEESPMHVAYLLEKKANPNLGSSNSALALAASSGNLEIVMMLVDSGANLSSEFAPNAPHNPLTWAAYHGRAEVCQFLVSRGANLEHRGPLGLTPLLDAAAEGHLCTTLALLQMGADVTAVDDNGASVAHHCAKSGLVAVVEILIELGSDINARNDEGETPLHWAYQALDDFVGEPEQIEKALGNIFLMIELGADQHVPDNYDFLPYVNATSIDLPTELRVAG